MLRKNFWYILVLFLSLSTRSLSAEIKEGEILNFPAEIKYRIVKNYDGIKHSLADLLFDSVNDFKVYDFSKKSSSGQVRLGRSIYDNHDVLNSYTVVDTMNLPFTLYAWSEAIGGQHFSFGLSVGGSFQLRNMRQVSRTKLPDLEDIDKVAQEVDSAKWEEAVATSRDPNDPPYKKVENNGEDDPLYWLDALNHARFRTFWNMAAFPVRLPFKADWLKRLDDGEIMIYGGSGFIEVGPSFAASKNFKGFTKSEELEVGVLSAYWRYLLMGEFRIAILKESEDFVKLKFRRHLQSGQRAGLGASTSRLNIYDGFAIKGKNVADIGATLMPFSLNWSKTGGPILEIGYRFDMRLPKAREAYEKAVMGRLALADQYAEEEKNVAEPAVRKLFIKEGRETTERNARETSLFIYKKSRVAEQRRSDVKLTLSDGVHNLYSAVAENTFESRMTFGSRKRLVTKSIVDYRAGSTGVVFEGWIEDSATDALELNAYEDIVEKVLGRGKIFERVPIFAPEDTENPWARDPSEASVATPRIAETGTSSFYYRMDFDKNMVGGFLSKSDADRWKTMEKVFGVEDGVWQNPAQRWFLKLMSSLGAFVNLVLYPLDLRIRSIESLFVANDIVDQWEDLRGEKDPKKFTYNFGRFFSDSVYGPEMMEVFTRSVIDYKPPFFLTAANYSFGRVVLQEGSFSDVGQTLEEYRRSSRFDEPQGGSYNVALSVKSFGVSILGEGRMQITFDLPVVPKYLYFRVAKRGFLETNKEEIIVLNFGQIVAGQNTLILDKRDGTYLGSLARAFNERGDHVVYFGFGTSTREWGPVVSQKVYYGYGEEKPEPLVDNFADNNRE